MIKVRRKEFDGITLAYGVDIGNNLEFEVTDRVAHFFKELGYEVEMPKLEEDEGKGDREKPQRRKGE